MTKKTNKQNKILKTVIYCTWLRWSAKWDKAQWKSALKINHNVYEACDLTIHWRDEKKHGGQKHQICATVERKTESPIVYHVSKYISALNNKRAAWISNMMTWSFFFFPSITCGVSSTLTDLTFNLVVLYRSCKCWIGLLIEATKGKEQPSTFRIIFSLAWCGEKWMCFKCNSTVCDDYWMKPC